MAGFSDYPNQYRILTGQQAKKLNIVLTIDGLDTAFGIQTTYTLIRYNDPGFNYGTPGFVYGGLRPLASVKPYLMLESGLSLSQRLEPEQGRASISQLSFSLIDKNGEVSKIISPGGGLLPEILGRAVQVRLGYAQSSYPEDYFQVFRGLITQIQIIAGRVVLTLGDANQKRRSATFKVAKNNLTASISPSDLAIQMAGTGLFYDLIVDETPLNPSLWSVKPYLLIEDEVIPYGFGAISGNTVTALGRGGAIARNTTAVSHNLGTEVTNGIEVNGHPIDIALKIMLSGWGGGAWKSGVSCLTLGVLVDLSLPPAFNCIVLNNAIDADKDFGLVVDDQVTISGSSIPSNNGTFTITGFGDSIGYPNQIIYLNTNLTPENPTSALLSFISQFSVYPDNAGLKLSPQDVDVKTHILLKNTIFTTQENFLNFYITSQQVGKDFIEKEIYLPIGAYSLTRYGKLSLGYTKPPIASDKVIVLDANNIIDPQSISMTRGLNTRRFFNEIQYSYERQDDGKYTQVLRTLDTDSLNEIGILQLLPINSSGAKSVYGGGVLADRISKRLLSRFKRAAFDIQLTTFWNPGTFIEPGDCVILKDNGYLKLTNFSDGTRDLKTQVFEVTDRTLDIKSGTCRLTLTSGLEVSQTARYGVVSPSSQISATGTTAQKIRIKPSYGNTSNEFLKWQSLAGIRVIIHDYNWTYSATEVFTGLNASDLNVIELENALPFIPSENDIVDIAFYGSQTDVNYESLAHAIYTYVDPTLTVLGGLSTTQFTLSLLDFAKLSVGQTIFVHNADYSLFSPEVTVTQKLSPNTVEVSSSLGFTPSGGQKIELVGFLDNTGAFRLL